MTCRLNITTDLLLQSLTISAASNESTTHYQRFINILSLSEINPILLYLHLQDFKVSAARSIHEAYKFSITRQSLVLIVAQTIRLALRIRRLNVFNRSETQTSNNLIMNSAGLGCRGPLLRPYGIINEFHHGFKLNHVDFPLSRLYRLKVGFSRENQFSFEQTGPMYWS
jgi:hypothetical protein